MTGPVDKDGYIDYVAALNERLGKGITPETNANVLIWKAIGPTPEGERMPAQFFKLMGMEEPPATGIYLVDSRRFLHEQFKIKDPGALSKIDRQFTQTTQYPWSADDYPETAAWLKANAAARPRCRSNQVAPGISLPLRHRTPTQIPREWFQHHWREPGMSRISPTRWQPGPCPS